MEIRFESIRYEFSTSNPIGITLHKFFNILDYAPWLKELEILVHYFCVEPSSALLHHEKGALPNFFFRNCTPYPVAS